VRLITEENRSSLSLCSQLKCKQCSVSRLSAKQIQLHQHTHTVYVSSSLPRNHTDWLSESCLHNGFHSLSSHRECRAALCARQQASNGEKNSSRFGHAHIRNVQTYTSKSKHKRLPPNLLFSWPCKAPSHISRLSGFFFFSSQARATESAGRRHSRARLPKDRHTKSTTSRWHITARLLGKNMQRAPRLTQMMLDFLSWFAAVVFLPRSAPRSC
jgi:hypothetical protein